MYEQLVQQKKIENYLKKLKTGFKCIKHGRQGSPHERWVSISSNFDKIIWKPIQNDNKSNKKSNESISIFTKIEKGCNTKPFKRSKKVKEELCFSLIGEERTLDFEFQTTEERDYWFETFQAVLALNQKASNAALSNNSKAQDLDKVANALKKFHFDIESSVWKFSKVLTKGSTFTDEDFAYLGLALNGNPKIETLDLSDIKLTDRQCIPVMNGIQSTTKNLSSIILSNNELTDESLTALSKAIKDSKSISLIDLSSNQISDQGTEDLASVLVRNTTLKTILLDKNEIYDNGAIALAESILNGSLVERLSLNDNHIGNKGAEQLARTLKSNESTLKFLELARNPLEFPEIAETEENDEGFSLEVSLFLAVDGNNYADVVLLTLQGADPNCQNEEDGKTPLHIAAIRGDRLMLDYLIEHPYIDINAVDDNMTTPIYCAMQYKQYDVVKLLLERGADYKIGDRHKKTILHLAAEQGNKAICKDLVEKYNDNIYVTTDEDMTPLHFAAQNLQKEVVQYLLEQDLKTRKSKEAPNSQENGMDDKPAGVILYVNQQDIHRQTPLHKVFVNPNPDIDIAKLLVQNGADVSIEDNNRRTPLHDANEKVKQTLLIESRNFMSRKGL
ncbi:hypothetical protein FDP41_005266 [Naegleria fowleri]|uniref:Uncharacterized protein n=1 Tax=Naegleria fowleri TaxID=5763 RepID=A0A6A5BSR2_NAEFO|nr:uncharacterized protein FDP41_005266 [Naegleria fowleri]KAF0975939.1 hypothetical protein FDP41_005266 [Naegleria fowleri]